MLRENKWISCRELFHLKLNQNNTQICWNYKHRVVDVCFSVIVRDSDLSLVVVSNGNQLRHLNTDYEFNLDKSLMILACFELNRAAMFNRNVTSLCSGIQNQRHSDTSQRDD